MYSDFLDLIYIYFYIYIYIYVYIYICFSYLDDGISQCQCGEKTEFQIFFTSLCNPKIVNNSVRTLRELLNMLNLNLIFFKYGNSLFESSDELLADFSAIFHFYSDAFRGYRNGTLR